jgi:glycine hydroxymethyltransferase
MELLCNEVDISINKNTVPGDKSALTPSAIRIGSPAMTTRGLKEKDFETIYEFLNRVTMLSKKIKSMCKDNKLSEFKTVLAEEVKGN